MKREGRQHGMVKKPNPKPVDAAANLHAKVLSKPSNHSKYTGTCRKVRCNECHSHPVTKSRDKAKGGYKQKSYDVSRNHQLVAVDTDRWNNFKGISATAVLGRLSDDYWNEGDDEDEVALVDEIAEELGLSATAVSGFLSNEYVNKVGDGGGEETGCYDDGSNFVDDLVSGGSGVVEEEEEEEEEEGIGGEICILDGEMDFYQVGFLVEDLDGEDWCVVSEM